MTRSTEQQTPPIPQEIIDAMQVISGPKSVATNAAVIQAHEALRGFADKHPEFATKIHEFLELPYDKQPPVDIGGQSHTNPVQPPMSGTGIKSQRKTPRDLRTKIE